MAEFIIMNMCLDVLEFSALMQSFCTLLGHNRFQSKGGGGRGVITMLEQSMAKHTLDSVLAILKIDTLLNVLLKM